MGQALSVVRNRTVDTSAFFKLTGRPARAVLLLFILTQWVLALNTLHIVLAPWVSLVALLIVTLSSLIVMNPGPFPLPTGPTALVVVSVIVSTAMVTWNLPTDVWPGYASWHLGANAFVLIALGLRGRVAASWVAMAAMTAICVAWTLSTGRSALDAIAFIDRQAALLLVGTIFSLSLRPIARAIEKYHDSDRRRTAQEAETAAGERERQRQAARLRAGVKPILQQIAANQLTEQDRDHIRVLEASLRDEIRAGALLHEPLTSSVKKARERGVDLLLLDDSGGVLPAGPIHRDAIAWAAGAVDAVEHGSIVIRMPPPRDDRIASISIEDAAHSRAIEFP